MRSRSAWIALSTSMLALGFTACVGQTNSKEDGSDEADGADDPEPIEQPDDEAPVSDDEPVDDDGPVAGTGGGAGAGQGGRGGQGGLGTDAGASSDAAGGRAEADGSVPRPTSDAGLPAPTPPSPDHVPIFMVQGGGFRTVASCDDGRTWALHVPGNGNGGDHSEGAPQGIAAGAGRFITANGWGAAGSLRVSEDGLSWNATRTNGGGFGGVLFAGGSFLVIDGGVMASSDGNTWQRVGQVNLGTNQRRFVGLETETGSVAIVTAYEGVGDANSTRRIAMSRDGGKTWKVSDIPDCVYAQQFEGGVAYGGGVFVSVGANGGVCRSTDGGATWTRTGSVGGSVGSVLWTGSSFAAYGGSRVYVSADGVTWQSQLLGGASAVKYVARSPAGTYAAVSGDGRQYFRSEDGRRWTTATGPSGTGFRHITWGYGRASAMCPK